MRSRRTIHAPALALILALALIPVARTARFEPPPSEPSAVDSSRPGDVRRPDPAGFTGEAETEEGLRWVPVDRGRMPEVSPKPAAVPTPRTSVVTSFAGLDATNFSPSDTTGAGGDNHVLTAANDQYQLFSRAGVPEVGPLPLDGFFPPEPVIEFDPRVVYDPYSDHYVLIYLGYRLDQNTDYLYVVSIPDATATTQATWCVRRFKSDLSNDGIDSWLDYPGLGFDANRIYVTGNLYKYTGPPIGAQIIAFKKAGLYDCARPIRKRVFGPAATRYPGGRQSRSIQPAVMDGSSANAFYLMASETTYGASTVNVNSLILYRIKKEGGRLSLKNVEVGVGPASIHPYAALQQGAPAADSDAHWDPGALQLPNVFYDAARGKLYTAHAAEKDIGNDGWTDIAVRWYEVRPASRLERSKVTRKGIFGTQNTDAGWPAVATDASGNVIIGFSRASDVGGAKEYLSNYATVIEPGDTVPDAGNTILLAPGDALMNVTPGAERWGDYQAINRDPVDGSQVWFVGQIAEGSGGPETDEFRQRVDLISFP